MQTDKVSHKPGPYYMARYTHDLGIVSEADGRDVALVRGNDAEAHATAGLLIAAPDLLAAMRRLVYFHDTDDTPNSDPWQEARAAIAKAEGRE